MSEKKKVLYAAWEAAPFVKQGGLGDVAGTLPMSIATHNTDIRVIMPYHKVIAKEHTSRFSHELDFEVEMAGKSYKCELYSLDTRGVIYYFIKNKDFFDRDNVYGEKDDLKRFALFSRAILECIYNSGGNFIPDILHCNDWHTSLTNLYLHEDYQEKLGKHNIKTMFTIHNLQYQGKYKYENVKDILCLKNRGAINKVMHKGKVNLMKCGISVSDCVTTPSSSYAKEILTYDYGEGLESVLKTKKKVTYGILNGMDYVDFNPAWDTQIKVHFTKDLIERRIGNKIDLQKRFKLIEDISMPLFCVACRFYEQKGISLILEAVPLIMKNHGQIIFLGDGDKKYKEKINEFKKQYPGCVGTHLEFDPLLPHNVYAGADVLLMPSKFEPCGIAQMMAMHYGCLPLVRSTGGLKDTVQNYQKQSLICNGFVFKNYNSVEFEKALDVVFDVWNNDKKNWRRMQKRGMAKDFSWKESGRKYSVLYDSVIADDIEGARKKLDAYAASQTVHVAEEAAKKAARHAQERAVMAEKVFEDIKHKSYSDEVKDIPKGDFVKVDNCKKEKLDSHAADFLKQVEETVNKSIKEERKPAETKEVKKEEKSTKVVEAKPPVDKKPKPIEAEGMDDKQLPQKPEKAVCTPKISDKRIRKQERKIARIWKKIEKQNARNEEKRRMKLVKNDLKRAKKELKLAKKANRNIK